MVKLKVKFLNLSAGRPVAILNKRFAEKVSIHVDERISISHSGEKIIAVVDIAEDLLREDEIALSTEIISAMKLKERDIVSIDLAEKPESLGFIYKKLNGEKLNGKELSAIIGDIVKNNLTESEIAYFVSAVYKCGMTFEETLNLIKALLETGKELGLKGEVADKHGTGGIPGRTTPIIVSICAAAGLLMPKTSSRAITTPAGTADALETVCKVDFSVESIRKILKKTNACMVWGGSLNLAPADDKIIQVERLLNLDPEPQLLASIIAKKLAVNAKYVLIDIPYGKYAKFNKKEAFELAKKFRKIGKYFKIKLECDLKEVNEPLGNGIGPVLEIKDVIKVLRRQSSCHKLEQRSLELAGRLLEISGKAGKREGKKLAKKILDSGLAYKKFLQIVKAQKGSIDGIGEADYKQDIISEKSGRIEEINIKEINNLARIAGCPLDKYAGVYLYKHLSDKVSKGEKILTIYAESETELEEAVKYYRKTKPIVIN